MRGWICLLAVCLLAACADSDDKERWVMKDGTVLYVEPEVRQYASEQEFADGMAAVHTRQSGGVRAGGIQDLFCLYGYGDEGDSP